MKYIVVGSRLYCKDIASNLNDKLDAHEFIFIQHREQFSKEFLLRVSPQKIFVVHWPYIIPEEILNAFDCVIFHMTDLPYGRGGSPLQNLIIRGHTDTKISALKAEKEIDAGPIYLKKNLSLSGDAHEILIRASKIIEEMILEITTEDITPRPQIGEPTYFRRRKPEDSNIGDIDNLEDIYNYIRMLDADGYPKAFLDWNHMRIEFYNAKKKDQEITAYVKITQK